MNEGIWALISTSHFTSSPKHKCTTNHQNCRREESPSTTTVLRLFGPEAQLLFFGPARSGALSSHPGIVEPFGGLVFLLVLAWSAIRSLRGVKREVWASRRERATPPAMYDSSTVDHHSAMFPLRRQAWLVGSPFRGRSRPVSTMQLPSGIRQPTVHWILYWVCIEIGLSQRTSERGVPRDDISFLSTSTSSYKAQLLYLIVPPAHLVRADEVHAKMKKK
jgi:hypothetical protein